MERLDRIVARNRAVQRGTRWRIFGILAAVVLLVVLALLIAYTDLAQTPVQPRAPAQEVHGIYIGRPPTAKPAPARPAPAPAPPAPAK